VAAYWKVGRQSAGAAFVREPCRKRWMALERRVYGGIGPQVVIGCAQRCLVGPAAARFIVQRPAGGGQACCEPSRQAACAK